jgi:hypothetical protein
LLTQTPSDGIDDIAFYTTGWPYKGCDAGIEKKLRALGKSLEALNDNPFDQHDRLMFDVRFLILGLGGRRYGITP